MPNFKPTDQLAIVTGAAGDIGQVLAAKLAESHDHVILLDINEAKANAVAESLGKDNLSTMVCDITDSTQTKEMAQKVTGLGGSLRTLVNNAGASWARSLHETTPDIWKRETTLNLDAAFMCFEALQDKLKESQGSVVNIASVNGVSIFGNPGYSAAKAGLIHFTKEVAVEYGKFGIRCNAVAPGTVRTQAWESRLQENPQVFEQAMQWYPLKHVIDPTDVANAVAFLSSNQAAAITGVCLPVDSGLLAGQAAVAGTFSQSTHY